MAVIMYTTGLYVSVNAISNYIFTILFPVSKKKTIFEFHNHIINIM